MNEETRRNAKEYFVNNKTNRDSRTNAKYRYQVGTSFPNNKKLYHRHQIKKEIRIESMQKQRYLSITNINQTLLPEIFISLFPLFFYFSLDDCSELCEREPPAIQMPFLHRIADSRIILTFKQTFRC